MMLLLLSSLIACGKNNADEQPAVMSKAVQRQTADNGKNWDQQIATAKITSTSYNGSNDYSLIPTSIKELKKYNPLLIRGTVYNLEKMTGCHNDAYTKVSVFVNKVISGDKSLQGKIINFSLNSGFIDRPKDDEFNYQKRIEAPMPIIGSQIITGLTPRKINSGSKNHVDKFFIDNNATGKLAFNIKDPANNLWIKPAGNKSFRLNNPYLNAKQKDDWYSKKLLQLTKELNQLPNK